MNDGWASANVTRAGTGHAGPLVAVRAYEHAIDTGVSYAGLFSPSGTPGLPETQVTIGEEWDALVIASRAGRLRAPKPVATPLAGAFRESVARPVTSYEVMAMPGEPMMMETRVVDAPAGGWTFQHVAAGGGLAHSFGVVDDAETVTLP